MSSASRSVEQWWGPARSDLVDDSCSFNETCSEDNGGRRGDLEREDTVILDPREGGVMRKGQLTLEQP